MTRSLSGAAASCYGPAVADTRAIAEQYVDLLEARAWDAWTALLDPDVVFQMPQSGERIRGRDRYLEFNQTYPADWHLQRHRVLVDGDRAVIWNHWRVGEEEGDAVTFLELAGGRVTDITDFWPEPFAPQAWRAHLVERS